MAADPSELAALTRRLRGKGLTDDQVTDSLRGLGFSKQQAEDAAGAGQPSRPAPPPPPKSQPAGGGPPSAGGLAPGIGVPQWSAPDLSKLTLTPPRRIRTADLGGFAAGLVAYTLALNFLRYGKPGMSGWIRAKFLNQTSSDLTDKLTDATSSAGSTSASV